MLYRQTSSLLREGPTEITVRVERHVISIKQDSVYIDTLLADKLPFHNNAVFVNQLTDFFYEISGPGFDILVDGLRVYIQLDTQFIGNTRGLCGTYNFKSSDDFYPPSGFIEADVFSFADSYKNDMGCTTPTQHSRCEHFIAVRIHIFIMINFYLACDNDIIIFLILDL